MTFTFPGNHWHLILTILTSIPYPSASLRIKNLKDGLLFLSYSRSRELKSNNASRGFNYSTSPFPQDQTLLLLFFSTGSLTVTDHKLAWQNVTQQWLKQIKKGQCQSLTPLINTKAVYKTIWEIWSVWGLIFVFVVVLVLA